MANVLKLKELFKLIKVEKPKKVELVVNNYKNQPCLWEMGGFNEQKKRGFALLIADKNGEPKDPILYNRREKKTSKTALLRTSVGDKVFIGLLNKNQSGNNISFGVYEIESIFKNENDEKIRFSVNMDLIIESNDEFIPSNCPEELKHFISRSMQLLISSNEINTSYFSNPFQVFLPKKKKIKFDIKSLNESIIEAKNEEDIEIINFDKDWDIKLNKILIKNRLEIEKDNLTLIFNKITILENGNIEFIILPIDNNIKDILEKEDEDLHVGYPIIININNDNYFSNNRFLLFKRKSREDLINWLKRGEYNNIEKLSENEFYTFKVFRA